ncbi:hypothetical protein ACFV3R_25035 [Streptomyces sp. NPDC059740]|uniref:hypothetical protein n=1 Tax=Streptomyces sp. NPDC059740 TaxID=3346926 RepID=UPI00365526DF
MSHDFPDDLVQLRREADKTRADLAALLERLPWSTEPMDGWEQGPERGYWRERRKDSSPGWTDEEKAQVAELRARLNDLVDQVHTHPYWDTLSGAGLVKARGALRHVDDPKPDDGEG